MNFVVGAIVGFVGGISVALYALKEVLPNHAKCRFCAKEHTRGHEELEGWDRD